MVLGPIWGSFWSFCLSRRSKSQKLFQTRLDCYGSKSSESSLYTTTQEALKLLPPPSPSFFFSPTSRVQTDRRRPSRHSTPPMPLRWSSSPLPSIQTATAPPLPSAQGFAFTYLRAESTPPLPSARGPASRPPSNSPVGRWPHPDPSPMVVTAVVATGWQGEIQRGGDL